VDSASCALLCCLALERYLGSFPSDPKVVKPKGTLLRARYLKKLLETWIAPSQRALLGGSDLVQVLDPISSEPLQHLADLVPELVGDGRDICDPGSYCCFIQDLNSVGQDSQI
jgi:hypothetical protein